MTNHDKNARRIVFLGAGGTMCGMAVERFARAQGDRDLVLCDIRPEAVQPLVRRLPAGRATVRPLDLFDRESLLEVIDGAALVVHGAGPYFRTAEPVMRACVEAGVPYLDFDDDVESTEAALALDAEARAAGVPLYIGCGASPGANSMLTVDAASELDTVETIDMCWMSGDERPGVSRALLEHLLHIASGDFPAWDHGGPVRHRAWEHTATAPMGGGVGETLLYESAHPEAVTMPRRYPGLRRVRVVGRLDPMPLNGLVTGLGQAVHDGRMTSAEAVAFVEDILQHRLGTPAGWRHTLTGLIGQVRRGESGAGAMATFLATSALGRTYPYQGGLLARVTGTRAGRPAVAIRRTPVSGPGAYFLRNMATLTGTSCAAFMLLALADDPGRAGTFAPEDWAEPEAFYAALERLGTPRAEIVEAVC
ncbi:saccharopine dehydrogenase family protein [Streptomyces sp. NPDC004673]